MSGAAGELYVGLNSGTSMDGLDAALVRFDADRVSILATHQTPYPDALVARLRALVAGGALSVAELAALDVEVGRLFAAATNQLLSAAGVPAAGVRALGCHGQTVYHGPDDSPPVTVQIGDPSSVAELTGIDTVADFRRRDLAAGGHGAPLAPALHAALFRSADEDRAVVNIGGIANLTLLPADLAAPVTGFDTGPGNCLMDQWIQEHRGDAFDADGEWAAGGHVIDDLLEALRAAPYFERPPPKSTGVESFHLGWARARAHIEEHPAADVQATFAELTATTIAAALQARLPGARRLLVCGGGAANAWLMGRLAHHLPGLELAPTDAFGLPARWVEVVLFAHLAREAVGGRQIDLTAVTGTAQPHRYGIVHPA